MEEDLAGMVPSEDQNFNGIPDSEEEGYTAPTEVIEQPTGGFSAPFNSPIGRSPIDLSIPANEEQMKKEYDEYWNYGRKRGFIGIPYTQEDTKQVVKN